MSREILAVTFSVRAAGELRLRLAELLGEDIARGAFYSDARKRAAVAAGIGAYLSTSLQPVVLPLGAEDRPVQVISRSGVDDLLVLSPATEE